MSEPTIEDKIVELSKYWTSIHINYFPRNNKVFLKDDPTHATNRVESESLNSALNIALKDEWEKEDE